MPDIASAWDECADDYSKRVSPFTSSFAPTLLDLAGPLDGGVRLLDVAAGDGAVALEAAARGASASATDVSPRLLELL
eukprot:2672723-Prymnesium_polylepis.1